MTSLFSFLIVLGILIFVHELGHFLFAKLFGVRVLTFSLGFGNKFLSRKWGDTEYAVSTIPLGGYVKMLGEGEDEEIMEEDKGAAYCYKPVWQRFIIVLAGPVFNLLFAWVLFIGMFACFGLPDYVDNTVIGKVTEDSPAEAAGLQAGDVIYSVDGKEISSFSNLSETIKKSGGKEVELVIKRGEDEFSVKITPRIFDEKNLFGEVVGERYLIGVSRSEDMVWHKVDLFEAFKRGSVYMYNLVYYTGLSIIKMIQGVVPASELGGPIRIAELAGDNMKSGLRHFINFMGVISISLGVLNLLPIPVLDGGHLVFMTYEAVRGKPLPERLKIIGQQIGMAMLAALMIFVFYNDIARLVSRWMAS